MLEALRGCITGAGSRLGAPLRGQLSSTLEAYMSSSGEDSSRTIGAAAMGALCAQAMTDDEMAVLMNTQLLGECSMSSMMSGLWGGNHCSCCYLPPRIENLAEGIGLVSIPRCRGRYGFCLLRKKSWAKPAWFA